LSITTYTLDLAAGLSQVLADGTNTYLYGLGRIAQQGPETTQYFLADALGSVRQLATSTGNLNLAQTYNPFGELNSTTGFDTTPYGFAGEWTDASGLQNLRARYYAPDQGRFLTRDTWAGTYTRPASLHRYTYAENNPVLYTDPSGHFADAVLDIGFLLYDLYRVEKVLFTGCGDLESELISLGLDAVGTALPFVTGLGMTARLGSKGDDVLKLLGRSDILTSILGKGDNIGRGTRQLFDPDKLQHILANLEKQGVYSEMSEEASKYLRSINAGAAYLPRKGKPGILIFQPNPSRLEVTEELLHLGQYRNLGWPIKIGDVAEVKMEIEAQHKLLELAKHLEWTQGEIDLVKKNLLYWKDQLNLLNIRGNP